jgi:ubiquinone/menaquinone biosynthesis C-methylase UbiE
MPQGSDRDYLLTEQYRDASNLNARIRLHQRFSTNQYGWHRWVFDRLRLPPEARVLELGCGPGTLWLENGDRIPAGWEITLTDFSPGMLEEARANLREAPHRFTFEAADAQAIPYADASFDAIIANHMLYHVPARARALSEARRVLRPSGRLYAATCGPGHLRELHDLVRQAAPGLPPHTDVWPAAFNLENGQEELARWFASVTLHRYEDALVVTETAPLVEYVLSARDGPELDGERLAVLTRLIEQVITGTGAVRITKEAGMFEAEVPS